MLPLPLRALGAAALALALAAPGDARRSRDWTDWGAVAIGPGGAFGLALHYDNEREAREAALRDCRNRCDRSLPFHDSCGAVAVARNGTDFWAVGPSREEASRQASLICAEEASHCRIAAVGCTD